MQRKIISNEQGICPACNNDITYYDVVDAEDAGTYKSWTCLSCKCDGKEYHEFIDHYDVYEKDGETRVDDEDATYRIKRERLIKLLSNALSTLHETTGEEESYETLYDLASDIGITEEEYDFVMGITTITKKYKVFNIAFDTDEEDDDLDLPTEMEIKLELKSNRTDDQEHIEEALSDEISNITEFCHEGLSSKR